MRDELIEALAKNAYSTWPQPRDPWGDLTEGSKKLLRDAVSVHVPVIVEFVAEWLNNLADIDCDSRVYLWREDMA